MAGVNGGLYPTQNATSRVDTNTTVLAANQARIAFSIQNLSTNTLYILLGSGATTSVFSTILKAGSNANDGTGGFYAMESGTIYNSVITCAGTSPSYVVTEIAP